MANAASFRKLGRMQIPQRLAYILERDQELDGAVKLSVTQLEPWINNSNLPFFPEYTKHDLGHIEAVLRTAVSLVRDEAWEAITPTDAGVLVLAVLLHDCAMHLLEDGFISLLDAKRSAQSIPGMNDKPWNLLWEDFCGEASRFDGRTLMRIFGETAAIRRPPLDPERMTKRDRLLIGEFVRRHHPRLAQEIAFFGVPTLGDRPLAFRGLSESKSYIAALSGIIARSHGADVRSFLPYLREYFDLRQYKGVHAVFLMTLLRVADYVQIDAERAPAQVLQVKRLASPVSQGEWKAHHAIRDIRHTHEDPEALFIDALPEDAQTFFRVSSWVKGIQHELDDSWAVLGEVYGRYEGLNELGLVLRRIRSTLDDVKEIAQKLPYLPIEARFRGSDADLLKLLIEPLYGNRPEVGLRELIQNSVDAVRELNEYLKDLPTLGDVPLTHQESDVVVSVETTETGESWVSVSDKGIGMTPEIVVDYFLTAGASFRRSEDWKQMFETSEGKSKVLRAGRFGVGALASFLLGPELTVSTRHVDEHEGVEFKADVETELIELKRISRPVGTTVRIRITNTLVEQLNKPNERDYYHEDEIDWDWYCLSQPSVARRVKGKELSQEYYLPVPQEALPADWRSTAHPDYAGILWTYSKVPELVCNGLRVRREKSGDLFPESRWEQRYGLTMPSVSVFDPDGRLPLNLQRTDPAETQYPFDHALALDVIRDFIAHSLVHGPNRNLSVDEADALRYAGIASSTYRPPYYSTPAKSRVPWYFNQERFGFLDASILQSEGFESVMVALLSRSSDPTGLQEIYAGPTIITAPDWYSYSETDNWLRRMMEYAAYSTGPFGSVEDRQQDWSIGGEDVLRSMKRKGGRILISASDWNRIVNSSRIRKSLRDAAIEEWQERGWYLLRFGECPPVTFDFRSLLPLKMLEEKWIISEIYLGQGEKIEPSPIALQWLKTLHCAEIPYDEAQRRNKLRHAYAELETHISAHNRSKQTV